MVYFLMDTKVNLKSNVPTGQNAILDRLFCASQAHDYQAEMFWWSVIRRQFTVHGLFLHHYADCGLLDHWLPVIIKRTAIMEIPLGSFMRGIWGRTVEPDVT